MQQTLQQIIQQTLQQTIQQTLQQTIQQTIQAKGFVTFLTHVVCFSGDLHYFDVNFSKFTSTVM